jgi:Flp pilus assembly protein TadD
VKSHLALGALLAAAFLPQAWAGGQADPWIRIRSANFELYTTRGERSGRDLIQYFERIRSFFLQTFGSGSGPMLPTRIMVFRSEREVRPYTPRQGSPAFFLQGSDHDYIVMQSESDDCYSDVVHEYTHLLVRLNWPDAPLWFNEGLAEFYSTLEQKAGKILVGKPPRTSPQVLRREQWLDLQTLLAADSRSKLYNEESYLGVFYAESWALVHMFMLDKTYSPLRKAMVEALKASPEAASLEKVYGKSLAGIQEDLADYADTFVFPSAWYELKASNVPAAPAVEVQAGFSARLALAELSAEMAANRIQAHEAYESLGREAPKDWRVEAGVARLYASEGTGDQALLHFQRAAELGADDPRMYLAYGRTLGEAGRAHDAVTALKTALRLAPDLDEARLELGQALIQTAAFRDAVRELASVKNIATEHAGRLLYLKAYAAYHAGDLPAALVSIEKARPLIRSAEERGGLDALAHDIALASGLQRF